MKSKIIGRKQILAIIISASLCLAVYVNWYYTKTDNIESNEPEITENINLGDAQLVNGDNIEINYYENARVNRTKAHDLAVEELKSIIESEADEATKEAARDKLTYLSEIIKLEADCENLISAQLSAECIVTIDADTAQVLISKEKIQENSIIKIKDIILTKTKVLPENITIVEIE